VTTVGVTDLGEGNAEWLGTMSEHGSFKEGHDEQRAWGTKGRVDDMGRD
jgi:hypothetical protein